MNLFDLFAVIVLVFAILAGIRTGALPQVGGVAGAIGGLLLVLALAPSLLDLTADLDPIPRALVVLGVVLAAVVIGEAIGSGLGRVLAGQLGRGVLSSMDRAAGGLLGAIQALLIVWLVGGLLAAGPFPTLGRAATQSMVVRGVDQVLPPPTEVVGEIAGALDASGMTDVFVGLDPLPLLPVDTPTDPQATRIAQAAIGGTARITTRACNSQVNGTGVIIAPGYVVTNAHVVAGASAVRVALDTGVVDAVPVLFDPSLDVAVLYAPRLAGRSLRFAAAVPERGSEGAAIGYAGGGGLVVLPAAVAGSYEATGRDIYDRTQVRREIIELRAAIEPGDSGGPLILENGTIGGLVFAESRADPDVGYALSPIAVSTRVMPAIGRTGAIDVGPCID
ncbi:MAG TPA: MarP family serine protease [Candidatus Limnocylindrales bacterium]